MDTTAKSVYFVDLTSSATSSSDPWSSLVPLGATWLVLSADKVDSAALRTSIAVSTQRVSGSAALSVGTTANLGQFASQVLGALGSERSVTAQSADLSWLAGVGGLTSRGVVFAMPSSDAGTQTASGTDPQSPVVGVLTSPDAVNVSASGLVVVLLGAPLSDWVQVTPKMETPSGAVSPLDALGALLGVDTLDTAISPMAMAAVMSISEVQETVRSVVGDANPAALADSLSGEVGRVSRMTGGAGNDSISGKNRADIAVFSGNRADYTITTSLSGTVTVLDKRNGSPDGTDTLTGINLLQFADSLQFVTQAANRVRMLGSTSSYQVGNSDYVTGTTAAEQFVVSPKSSAYVSVGAGDTVDLAGAIDSYSYRSSGNLLQISDGIYTTTVSYGGSFTLRTASGATSVSLATVSGVQTFKFGTVNVSTGFDPRTGITDPANLSSNASAVGGLTDVATLDLAVFGVTVNGEAKEGGQLSASSVLGNNAAPATYKWQISADGSMWNDLAGATSATYSIASDQSQVEKYIRVVATVLNPAGVNTVLNSAPTPAIANVNDPHTGTVSITGQALVGQTLTASNTLADEDGLGTINYQWRAGGVDIVGAIGSTYKLTSAEVGKVITAVASYTDLRGTPEFEVSPATAPVTSAVTVTTSATPYTATSGVDIFVIDGSQSITATISGFRSGDMLQVINVDSSQPMSVDYGQADPVLTLGFAFITLTGLEIGAFFVNEADFQALYGPNAIFYGTSLPSLDTTGPVFQSAATSTDGLTLVLTFDEALSATSAAASAFTVNVAGALRSVSGVTVSGSSVSLTLSSPVLTGQAVTVSYTDPSTGNDPNAVQDAAGNDAATLAATSVTNLVTGPVTTPTVSSFTVSDATAPANIGKAGEALMFTLALSEPVTVNAGAQGGPKVSFGFGTSTVLASYDSAASTSTSLVFRAAAPTGDSSSVVLKAIDLNGATVTGQTGNQPLSTAVLNQSAPYTLDNTLPVVTTSALSVAENTTTVGTLSTSVSGETVTWALAEGTPTGVFTLTANGALSFAAAKNFELDPRSYVAKVTATDAAGNVSAIRDITVSVTDVNEAPTALSLTTALSGNQIAENTSTTNRIKLADLVIADDAIGSNAVTLSGSDAPFFVVQNKVLYLEAGTALDFEAKSSYQVSVTVMDGSVAGSTALTANYALAVFDENEAPIAVGSIGTRTALVGQPFTLDLKPFFSDPDSPSTMYGQFRFVLSGGALPPGLILDQTNGIISGQATSAAPLTALTVTIYDNRGSGEGFQASQPLQMQAVSATGPVVTGFAVNDATAPTNIGKAGEALMFTLALSEPVTVNAGTQGGPTVSFGFGTSTVLASYDSGASTSTSLVFRAAAPTGDSSSVVLKAIDLNGATVTGQTGNQPLSTSVLNQSAPYTLDNTVPPLAITSTETLFTTNTSSIVGTTEPLSKITISRDGQALTSLQVAANTSGQWSVTAEQLGLTTDNDAAQFSFQSTDQAGNQSASILSRILMRLPATIEQAAADAVIDRASNTVNDTVRVGAGDGTYLLGGGNNVLVGFRPTDAGYSTQGDNLFKGGTGNDRFLNIGDADVFVGGLGVDAVLLSGIKPADLARAASAEIDATLQQTHGETGQFLVIQSASTGSFYLSGVEYLEFAGDGTRIPLSSFYGNYTQGVL
jgi:uncharacterized repeat protein (TIGR02059 family)